MIRLLQLAREAGHAIVRLHAQTHAMGFYRKHGFVPDGVAQVDDGVREIRMVRRARAGPGESARPSQSK